MLKTIKDSDFVHENEIDNEIKSTWEIMHVINLNNETNVNVYRSVKNFIDNSKIRICKEYVLKKEG